jgi:DNA-binding NarL/FixJ family response regulator
MCAHNLVLADDHPRIREYVRNLLASDPELHVTGEVSDGLALLQLMEYSREWPEIIILDITMPKMHGIEAARRIKAQHPEIKIIVLTIHKEREYLQEALSAGAEGYVLKDVIDLELPAAISDILAGRRYVSRYFRRAPDDPE